jgi:hypothetical protein
MKKYFPDISLSFRAMQQDGRARAVCVCFLIVTEALARPRVKEDV